MNTTVKIRKGRVLVYRIFDIAEEINIPIAESILRNPKGSFPFKVPKYIDRAIVVKSLPAAFELGEIELSLECGTYKVDVVGKIRDYGVLSLVYQIRVPEGASWADLVALASDLEEGTAIDPIAIAQAKVVCEQLAPALKQASDWMVFEDYVVYFCEEFEGDTTASNLLERADVPALLLAEDDSEISQKVRNNILENIYQYSTTDMAVVEWNSALVVEPKGGMEVPEIIEFALTHLLEMRYYDDLLDKRLAFLYDDIERSKGNMLRGRFSQIYQDASSRYIEFSEFIERVENSLKVVGDFYLATVYRAATRRFRLSDWQQNVTRKMNLLAQVSSLLQGEVNMRRSHWMEITIILLIAFEIVSALLKLN